MELRHRTGLTIAKASHRVRILSILIARNPPNAPAATALALTTDVLRNVADRHDLTQVAACARDISSSLTRPLAPPEIALLTKLAARLEVEVQRITASAPAEGLVAP